MVDDANSLCDGRIPNLAMIADSRSPSVVPLDSDGTLETSSPPSLSRCLPKKNRGSELFFLVAAAAVFLASFDLRFSEDALSALVVVAAVVALAASSCPLEVSRPCFRLA